MVTNRTLQKNHTTKFIIGLFLCWSLLISCKAGNQNEQQQKKLPDLLIKKGTVHTSIGIDNYPNETYAIYLPTAYQPTINYPIYIFCDPQGVGSFPISKYKTLAEKYQVIIVGSNNSRNGININDGMGYIQHIIDDCDAKYAIDDSQINICGFSGGAKVAMLYAAQTTDFHIKTNSVICAGATTNLEQAPTQMPILLFAGTEDMNYTDLLGFQRDAEKSANIYFSTLVEFNGKHEWPDSFTYEFAFLMNDKSVNTQARAAAFIRSIQNKNYTNEIDKINMLEAATHLLKKKTDTKEIQHILDAEKANPNTKVLLAEKLNQLATEQAAKEYYNAQIGQKELGWWASEVNKLNHPATINEQAMNKRLLGYLSLAGYSYSSRYINQNDLMNAKKMLDFYGQVDPTNKDQPYLSAIMYAKMNDRENTLLSLKKTIALGFNDKNKILTEPAFQFIQKDESFREMIVSMK
jgi:dienelactone hydrolase